MPFLKRCHFKLSSFKSGRPDAKPVSITIRKILLNHKKVKFLQFLVLFLLLNSESHVYKETTIVEQYLSDRQTRMSLSLLLRRRMVGSETRRDLFLNQLGH